MQMVEYSCGACKAVLGVVDFDSPYYAKEQQRIFFAGLGQWNRANHALDCPAMARNDVSFSPIQRRMEPA